MDHKKIGLISYQEFLDVLKDKKLDPPRIVDSFDWEQGIVTKIKEWIRNKSLTVEDAFKCFDQDFDGYVSKIDLKKSIETLLGIPSEEIVVTKVDRLFRLMDFFKQGSIQLSDFQRLLGGGNPYSSTQINGVSQKMSRSMGGALGSTSTFNWKFSAI